jgi:hypothetical protein
MITDRSTDRAAAWRFADPLAGLIQPLGLPTACGGWTAS